MKVFCSRGHDRVQMQVRAESFTYFCSECGYSVLKEVAKDLLVGIGKIEGIDVADESE